MIAALVLPTLEWAGVAGAALVAGAATTVTEIAIAAVAVVCAALCRQFGGMRAQRRFADRVEARLYGIGAPANDGGRDGR